MKTKLIGITARALMDGTTRKQFVTETYIKAMHSIGFNTIMLTLDNVNNEELLPLCDGFVVTGGYDIDPKYFNEENKGESKNCDPHLDEMDKVVIEYAVKHKLPMLGICRGHQTINVFMGGSLFQDIGQEHNGTKHKVHTIKNRFFNFDETIETNSYHHQAIKTVAPDFTVIAKAEDNTIEAIVHNYLPIVCFQWHPEMMQGTPISNEIFNKFKELF